MYEKKNRILEEAYWKKKAVLDGEIAKLRRGAENIKAVFERQNSSWEEGMNILKDATSLRDMVAKLRNEASGLEGLVKQTRLSLSQLEERRENLGKVVSALSSTYSSYELAPNRSPKLERLKSQLLNDIKELNMQKTELENEIAKLKGELKRLRQEEEARKALILALADKEVKVKAETDRLIIKAEELANRIVKSAKTEEDKNP
ncbi:MAG: hypothetical protein RMI04_08545 [Thermofilaceae archaeon]|nr:hypothetical protein [Thermofilaceae archaeon]